MLGPRRLGHSQNPSPQDLAQFSDTLSSFPPLDGMLDQLGRALQVEFLLNVRAMRLDRFHAEMFFSMVLVLTESLHPDFGTATPAAWNRFATVTFTKSLQHPALALERLAYAPASDWSASLNSGRL